ncbi:MAG TPA: hypothetical protein PKX87_03665 [Alphaproteobacteria bacterium]|nr:hypothetical protein [Alphaproteobacteria bacterium]
MTRRHDDGQFSQKASRAPCESSESLWNRHFGMDWVRKHWSKSLERRYADQWILVGPEGIVASGNSLKVLEEELKINRPGHSMADFPAAFIPLGLS